MKILLFIGLKCACKHLLLTPTLVSHIGKGSPDRQCLLQNSPKRLYIVRSEIVVFMASLVETTIECVAKLAYVRLVTNQVT